MAAVKLMFFAMLLFRRVITIELGGFHSITNAGAFGPIKNV